jgi:hypothetical protein
MRSWYHESEPGQGRNLATGSNSNQRGLINGSS